MKKPCPMRVALTLALCAAGAHAGGAHDVTSNAHFVAPLEISAPQPSASGFVSGFKGRSTITQQDLYQQGVVIYGAAELSRTEFDRIRSLPDRSTQVGEAGPEVVIGWDTRERVYTGDYPTRARVLITFDTPTGGARCSGTLIGSNTVVTAGHCVHSGGSRGTWYSPASYMVYAGADGSSTPYGYCTAKQLYSVSGWSSNGNELYDYGAIKLNCTIGDVVGYYGWTTTVSTSSPAIIGGYPGDKPLTHWIAADRVRALTTEQVFYQTDTTPGSSGSGVWYDFNGPYLIGVHAYGTHGASGVHAQYNHGKRVTSAVSSNFSFWKAAL